MNTGSSSRKAHRLCPECDQPMLPKGAVKRPNEYDHASGCPIATIDKLRSALEKIAHGDYCTPNCTAYLKALAALRKVPK